MQLRRATGEINTGDPLQTDDIWNQRQQRIIHLFRPCRAGIDMAVRATLVAAIAEIQLQRAQCLSP